MCSEYGERMLINAAATLPEVTAPLSMYRALPAAYRLTAADDSTAAKYSTQDSKLHEAVSNELRALRHCSSVSKGQ